jgi:hydroxymethylbilane synthase
MPATKASFVVATRGSALALAQASIVLNQCRAAFPDHDIQLRVVKTTGDKLQAESSAEVDLPKGLFTRELEVALLNGDADLAVHSLKDLPTELPPKLMLGAVTKRADVRDALIYRRNSLELARLTDLPAGFVVATSSPRRQAQLLSHNKDLRVVPIRGNVPTRLQKLVDQPDLGALVLAMAGLQRLGYSVAADGALSGAHLPDGLAAFVLSLDDVLPCVGQGALGIEIREADEQGQAICAVLNDAETEKCALAERAFLSAMGGGCQTPVAAHAEIDGRQIRLRAVSFETGSPKFVVKAGADARELGRTVAAEIKRLAGGA